MIRKAEQKDIQRIMEIVEEALETMRADENDQWDADYPQIGHFQRDIQKGELYIAERDGEMLGMVCINREAPEEYRNMPWSSSGPVLVLHRMAVAKASRNRGIAREMLMHGERLAASAGISALRTDTFSLNGGMNQLLSKCGYSRVGTMEFMGKAKPFYCYEKVLV